MTGCATTLALRRVRSPGRAGIPLVPMIDVLMILLVFFMVTSTYLDLDVVPMSAGEAGAATADGSEPGPPLIVRIAASGETTLGGNRLTPAELGPALRERIAEAPDLELLLLPSGGADVQALVTVMDTATDAGVQRLRLLRLEARP